MSIEGSITDSKTVSKTPNIIINNTNTKPNIEKEEKANRFSPPTMDEVIDYFMSIKELKPSDAEERANSFYHFYNSKNWMVGKNKMSNWKSAATKSLSWENKGRKGGTYVKGEQSTKGTNDSKGADRKAEIMRRASKAVANSNNGD